VVAGTTAPSSTGTVSSFNGRTGAVTPGSSDYTAAQVSAVPALATVAGKNAIINGGADIWQRGTTFTSAGYTADRFYSNGTSGFTISQATGIGLTGFNYAMRVQRNSGSSTTSSLNFGTSIETLNSLPMAGQTVTLSFWARAGSGLLGTMGAQLYWGTGTDQNVLNGGFTGQTSAISTTASLTTSWQRFTVSINSALTASISSNATEIGLNFPYYNQSGTAGANDYFDITGVQLEIGSTATAFSRAGGTIQGELAACQRYLPAFYPPSSANADFFLGYAYATNATLFFCNFNVPARVPPTGITPTGTFNALALNSPTTVTPSFNSANQFNGSILASQTIVGGQGSRMTMAAGALLLFTGCEL